MSSPTDVARGPLRRAASSAKGSFLRTVKLLRRGTERAWRRINRGLLVGRKQAREQWKPVQRAMTGKRHPWRRTARMWRRESRRLRRWIWSRRRLLRFGGRTRTFKQAAARGAVPLEFKTYEIDRAGNKLAIRTVQRTVSGLAARSNPIIVGPWLSEVGFELLYWIPFVHWAQAYGELDPSRLWVVSRGGTSSWYRFVTDNYVEIYDTCSPDEFRERNVEREASQGGRKHRDVSTFDRDLIESARRRIGTDHVDVLHPSLMYNLFQAYFLKWASIRLVEAFSYFRGYADSNFAPPGGLPDQYVAVKFYGNDSFPTSPENRRFVRDVLSRLSRRTHVVSLDTGIRFDDHDEFRELDADRVRTVELDDPASNLAVQTEVIRGATAFYGTYGGFSYLAPLLGVRTAAFYSNPAAFRTEHLDLAQRVFSKLDCPSFLAMHVDDLTGLGWR